ncbi:MAG: hypothetical protein WAU07_03475 [Microgenomates group bacterium]
MIDKKTFIPFDELFPETKNSRPLSREKIIKLAKSVATALEEESERLAKEREQSDPPSTKFFLQT